MIQGDEGVDGVINRSTYIIEKNKLLVVEAPHTNTTNMQSNVITKSHNIVWKWNFILFLLLLLTFMFVFLLYFFGLIVLIIVLGLWGSMCQVMS